MKILLLVFVLLVSTVWTQENSVLNDIEGSGEQEITTNAAIVENSDLTESASSDERLSSESEESTSKEGSNSSEDSNDQNTTMSESNSAESTSSEESASSTEESIVTTTSEDASTSSEDTPTDSITTDLPVGITMAGPDKIDTTSTTQAPEVTSTTQQNTDETTSSSSNLTLAEEVVHLDASKGRQVFKHKNTTTRIDWVKLNDVEDDFAGTLGNETSTEAADNLCPETKNGISNEARIAVVEYHNRMRTKLARGQQRDKRSVFAPPAKDLLKMMYDCDIEANAQKWADACKHRHTDAFTRRSLDIGENLAWIPGNRTDKEFVTFSSFLWWREVESIGIGNDTTFFFDFLRQGLGHYTQMAWHGSFRLGCGMSQCNDWMFVVCQYSPRGNGPEGRKIYTIGSPCQSDDECPGMTRCIREESLCEYPPELVKRVRRSNWNFN